MQSGTGGGLAAKAAEKNDGDGGEKDELVLQDTFAQETAVMDEDPNMCVKYTIIIIVFVAVVFEFRCGCCNLFVEQGELYRARVSEEEGKEN